MPKNPIRSKIIPPYQDYRQKIGNHVNWQDKRIGNQQYQDTRVKRLANYPGLNSENVGRQNATHAMVQLLGILSVAELSSANLETTQKNIDKRSSPYWNYQQAFSDNVTNYYIQDNHSLRVSREINLNSTNLYSQHVAISKPVHEITTQRYIRAASVTPLQLLTSYESHQKILPPRYSENISKLSLANQYKTSSLKKRSIASGENIPNKISSIVDDHRFHINLRNALEIIFKLSQKTPEIRFAPEADKNLFILMKCIQQLNIFIIKDNPLGSGEEILDALLKIADDLDTPRAKAIFSKFKNQFLSENANTAIKASNLSMYDATHKMQLVGDMIVFNPNDKAEIIFKEQTQLLFELLEKDGLIADQAKPLTLVNNMVLYLSSGKDYEMRITKVARHLLEPMGLYGSGKEEYISAERKMAVIAGYLNYAILGMNLEAWVEKKIQIKAVHKNSFFTNRDLEMWLNDMLMALLNEGKFTLNALDFYRNKFLNKLLPTLALQLNAEDRIELKGIDITQPRWGFIHAGARILNDSGANLGDMRLTDIEDVGIILNLMLCEKSVPQTYAGYFRLPALIYYAKTKPNALSIPMINEYDMQKIFQHYFDYVEKWQKINSPIEQLNDLLNDWKTRPDLAKNKLRHYKISYDWLTNYLNSHGEMKLASKSEKRIFETNGFVHRIPNKIIQLPNIDKIFEDQNLKLADALLKVDELLLPQIFNSLSEDAQRFIEQSRVDRVRIQFNARDSISGVALAPSSQMGLVQSDAFVYHIPDHIDLLQCTLKGAKISYEHIYALTKSNATGSYMIKRVDRDRKALLDLLDDSGIPRYDEDYKIRVTSHLRLKEENDPPGKLIENLAEVHKKKLLIKLYNQGYDKTTQEKVKDFLLSLIPFYTCITEGVKGNEQEATLACIFDVISLGIPLGRVAYIGSRFSVALGGSATMALRYGARQATVRQILRESGNEFIRYTPMIGQEISPQIARGLGAELINGLDPGIGLLEAGGIKGISSIRNIFLRIKNKPSGMSSLSDALSKNSAHLSSVSQNKNIKYEKNNGNFIKEKIKEEEIIYDIENYCYRARRGIDFNKLCSRKNLLNTQPSKAKSGKHNPLPMIAEGSIGAVYDTGDGYVIKKYKGKIDRNHKSRLQAANNNAKGFNRYYGKGSAIVDISPNVDETASVSIKLKKIDGIPLDSINKITDHESLSKIASNININDLSGYLANSLRDKGILHNDINKGNIIYNGKNNEFYIIDFDSANFLPEGEILSKSQTESMKTKFTNVFNDVLRDVNKKINNRF